MPNFGELILSTNLSGIGQYRTFEDSISMPATSLSAFGSFSRDVDIDLERTDNIHQIHVRFTGIETVWRVLSSYCILYIPTFSGANEVLKAEASFSGSTLTVTATASDASGSSNTSPSFTLDVKVYAFVAPFST